MLDVRKRTGWLFFAIMIGQVILVSAQVQSKSGMRVLSVVTFEIFSRVERATAGVIDGTTGLWSNYVALRGVRAENVELQKQVADLQVQLQQQRALASSAERLQQLLDLKGRTDLPTLAAEVIAGNPDPGMRTVTINRGSVDGVQPDMAVIAPQGIVGRVIGDPARHAARVQLIVDRNAALGAITARARAGGMIVGSDGTPALNMELVSNLADVKPGDTVVASGVDGIYPKGFLIGTVDASQPGPQLYRTITVRPSVDFSSLEEVLVVMVPARQALGAESQP